MIVGRSGAVLTRVALTYCGPSRSSMPGMRTRTAWWRATDSRLAGGESGDAVSYNRPALHRGTGAVIGLLSGYIRMRGMPTIGKKQTGHAVGVRVARVHLVPRVGVDPSRFRAPNRQALASVVEEECGSAAIREEEPRCVVAPAYMRDRSQRTSRPLEWHRTSIISILRGFLAITV